MSPRRQIMLIALGGLILAAALVVLSTALIQNSEQGRSTLNKKVENNQDKGQVTRKKANDANVRSKQLLRFLKGDQGLPGVAGKNGVKGAPGPAGLAGKRGPGPTDKQVKDAVAAYCKAHDQCRGQDGADGVNGVNGADGKNGVNGTPGAKGDKGSKGDTGPPPKTFTCGPPDAQGVMACQTTPATP